MIQLLFLALSIIPSWAQQDPTGRFTKYCAQISAPVPSQNIRPNSQMGRLMAVVDAVNSTPKHMREAIARGEDYEQFKAESAKQNVRLNEYFHQANYANVARAKCEPLITESGSGLASNEAFTAPTDQQLDRRVDDSGIGVSSPTGTGEPSGTEQ